MFWGAAYIGPDGIYSEDYQSAFRQGAGSAIAALARAAMLAKETGKHGEFNGEVYLADTKKAFHHLQDDNAENNKRYADDGWFISNDINSNNLRPFYHAADAGFPILSLSQYLTIEHLQDKVKQAKQVISKHLAYQLQLNNKVSKPFNYSRQPFKVYNDKVLSKELQEGFFIPHANENEYWWQGESARLSSLAMAEIVGGKATALQQNANFGITTELAQFAQNQMDWTLGRNPCSLCMLNGFGDKNPVPYDGLSMVYGGISNGVTGAKTSDSGRGIEFGPESDWQSWRWVVQWLPHSTWFLLATTEMAK